MLKLLGKTVGIESDRLILLDALRKQRNIADYSGDLVEDAAVTECIKQPKQQLKITEHWLKSPLLFREPCAKKPTFTNKTQAIRLNYFGHNGKPSGCASNVFTGGSISLDTRYMHLFS